MDLHILIADSRDVFRTGLHTLFERDPRVVEIYEATTGEILQKQIASHQLDLIVVHQSLILTTLNLTEERILIDPALSSWVLKCIVGDTSPLANNGMLTPREQEIFEMLQEGLSNSDIANQLNITESTVKTHIGHLLEKLHMKRRQIKMSFVRD